MSVIIETTLGDITVDLFVKERPRACLNFLKLCKIKYYNFCVFHSLQRNFVAQTGDPTGTGRGGESIFRCIYGDQAKYFDAEKTPKIKHRAVGTISMVNDGNDQHGSQFLITLSENLDYLDGVHTVIGQVAEGEDVLLKINETFCDKDNRPYKDIRITHTIVLDDPLDDLPGMLIPERSPEPTREQVEGFLRIAADEDIDDNKGLNENEIAEKEQRLEADHQAQVLEIIGDLPDKDVKPPDNVLFVCKLNSVTTDEDLEIIFSRFGKILSCEIIREYKSKESLQYAFIEFETPEQCEKAYLKMDNVLIDDRRIHVDFSQSVSLAKYRRHNDPTHMEESRTEDKDGQKKTKHPGSPKRKQHKKEMRDEYRDRKRNTRSRYSDQDSDEEVRCGKHSKRRSHSSDISRLYDDNNKYHKRDSNSEYKRDKYLNKHWLSKHSSGGDMSKHKKKSYKQDR